MSLETGTWVGRFRITRLIAQGGMAEVYRAEQELAGGILRPAALKVIRPEYSGSQDFREMFLDEARLACTLSHPNIVHIYEVGEADGRLYMAMELVPGESLAFVARDLREKGERLPDDALIAIGISTCSALEMVHGLRLPGEGHVNLVHRDVSPHNLLLGPSGSLKLIDFGIAKAASNRNLTSPGVTKGKAGYFSPEQAMGRALDGRSDLFSLGVTLYKLAWGGTPFDEHRTHLDRNTALVHGRWRALRDVCPGLPEGFYDVVDRALQVKPEDRFTDAAELRMALERLALTEGFHVGPSTLAGYVERQEDDPHTQGGARPAPSSARLQPLDFDPHRTVPGRSAASHRHTVAQSPSSPPPSGGFKSGPSATRHTLRISRAASSPTTQVIQTKRRLFLVSSVALVCLAVLVGLMLGERAARDEPSKPPGEGALVEAQPQPPREAVPVKVDPPAGAPERDGVPPVRDEPQLTPEDSGEPTPSAVTVKRESARSTARAERTEKVASASASQHTRRAQPKGKGRLRVGGADDAVVLVNGRRQGVSPLDLQVSAGTHSVVVRSMDGTRQLSERVEVEPDRTSRVVFDFERNLIRVGN